MSDWYKQSPDKILKHFNTSAENGLAEAEAARRLEEHGPNELVESGLKSPWHILGQQFTDTMVIVLIIAAVLSGLLGETTNTIAIIAIVVLNALLGFWQEYQAEQSMAALKKLSVPTVRVRRDGQTREISARDVVPGDVVYLEAGNLVPTDGRLIESVNLRVQESTLTGESEPVEKATPALEGDNLPLGDRFNVVYMGTVVTYGRGQLVVTETGMDTELGHIAEMLQSTGTEPTPLQRRLDQLGKGLAWAALALVGLLFGVGLLRGEDPRLMFMAAISLAVAAVPEGLPAVVTISLALGARRMLERHALIRKLPAVEALGSVTVICSDKTGTLTENRMTVTVLDVANHKIELDEDARRGLPHLEPDEEQIALLRGRPALALTVVGGALCNDASLAPDPDRPAQHYVIGDPTEGALLFTAARMGLQKESLEAIFPRVAEVPFDSERKRMVTVHKFPASPEEIPPAYQSVWDWEGWIDEVSYVVFAKGAVDSLLEVSAQVWVDDHIEPLDEVWVERINEANARLAQSGMRVLGAAVRSLDAPPGQNGTEKDPEQGLIFVGMVGMIDPARPEVREAVQTCKTAGIRPIMITGDHPLTAGHIAEELGIGAGDTIVTGRELEKMSPAKLEEIVEEVSVYARVSPEHKLRIVQALQNRGEIAAMTGDGVNDAPALKKANIGVAMGITGTDVSKEAADMVLLDDNFATIVTAVEEGRVIYDNIRKFIKYTLSSNAGEIFVMMIAPLVNMPLPLLPLQILWINLVTDGLPGLALGVELPERDTMRRPPYPPDENVFARGLGRGILWIGLLMGLVSLGLGFGYWRAGRENWQTMLFTTMTLSEMGVVMGLRSRRASLFRIGIFSNPALLGAVLLTFVLQLAVIYVPFLQSLFKTMPLSAGDLALSLGLGSVVFWAMEIQKWWVRRRGQ